MSYFYATPLRPCPYLPDRQEQHVITDLWSAMDADIYDTLSEAGFRRNHALAYMPACPACTACIPYRIVCRDFLFTPRWQRICNRNKDLHARIVPLHATDEQFALFETYQRVRHYDSEMAGMAYHEYASMIEETPVDTFLTEWRDGNDALVAVCLMDRVNTGLSAVYSFFDPTAEKRSLGSHMILWFIEQCRDEALPYVYLGYWIQKTQKMIYKSHFRPAEYFDGDRWRPFQPETQPVVRRSLLQA